MCVRAYGCLCPKMYKCLVVGDIIVSLDAVGLLVVAKPTCSFDALVDSWTSCPAFHVKVSPFPIVATNTSPKLSSDQRPGSSVV